MRLKMTFETVVTVMCRMSYGRQFQTVGRAAEIDRCPDLQLCVDHDAVVLISRQVRACC